MDLLPTYSSESDEEQVILPTSTQDIVNLLPNDPRRKSTDIDQFKKTTEINNPKAISNWNQRWNLNLHGSNIPKETVHGRQSFPKPDTVRGLVSEAQVHTADCSLNFCYEFNFIYIYTQKSVRISLKNIIVL